MGRVHLFEFEDQEWFPALLRSFATDYLQFSQTLVDQVAPLAPSLADLARRTGARRFVDLCSGGSGPWARLVDSLVDEGCRLPVVLTDRFPNETGCARVVSESKGRITMHPEPVDVLDVPKETDGVRTLFNAFHHFRPRDAALILEGAARSRQPIFIAEFLNRSALSIVGVLFAAILGAPIATPFIRPFRWSRLLFTYVIPLVPLLVLWDGIVSCLRMYSPSELERLVGNVDVEDYEFEVGQLKNPSAPVPITYLIGWPKAAAASSAAAS